MKTPPDTHDICEHAVEHSLHQAGRRMTRQRQAVYDAVLAARNHPSAEQVYDRLRRDLPHLSLATVYNALEALVECGLLAKIPRTDESPARYDWRHDAHHHARCVGCSKVWDIEDASVAVETKHTPPRFKPVGYKVEVLVECPDHCEPRKR